MHKRWYLIFGAVSILSILCLLPSCSNYPSEKIKEKYWPTAEWRTSTPEDQGVDSERLLEMVNTIQKKRINLHSLLIIKNGYLITEIYWQPYGPDDIHTIESITKPIIASLVGIAINNGEIQDVHQELGDFFSESEYQPLDDQVKKITLKNLLTMTPGLDCADDKIIHRLENEGDWLNMILNLKMTNPPGKRWVYCSAASHLLSAILEKSTGKGTDSYADQHLFNPLGIPAERSQTWKKDPMGITSGIQGLYLTPREIAKFGYLYLMNGEWENQQIVPRQWVADSTTTQAKIGEDEYLGDRKRNFGYLWSVFPKAGYYGFIGMAGQELFVYPQEDLVVVFTGATEVGKEVTLMEILDEHIIPSIISNKKIPANPKAQADLNVFIKNARESRRAVPDLPQAAVEISNHTYQLTRNTLGWSDMTFLFEPGSDVATLKMSGSPDLKIGLDNVYRLTVTPDNMTIGLRGEWTDPETFELDYIIFGDFIRSKAAIRFQKKDLALTINYLNWNVPPIIIKGHVED